MSGIRTTYLSAYRREPLKGISGVCVDTSGFELERYPHGIERIEVQEIVELMLRVVGIPVVSEDEARELNWPALKVRILLSIHGSAFVYQLMLHLIDVVKVHRTDTFIFSSVWEDLRCGVAAQQEFVPILRSELSAVVTSFCNDLLAANPGAFVVPNHPHKLRGV